jgi:hypothetical protein
LLINLNSQLPAVAGIVTWPVDRREAVLRQTVDRDLSTKVDQCCYDDSADRNTNDEPL